RPANFLNRTDLPSITGLPASGPIAPRPSTAVPLVTTPTRLPRAVRFRASPGSRTISSQQAATPGVYARARSRWLVRCLVGRIDILPGGLARWYSSELARMSWSVMGVLYASAGLE